MSGRNLLEPLRREAIAITVALMTRNPDPATRRIAERHGALLLEMPCSAEALLRAIEDALRGARLS